MPEGRPAIPAQLAREVKIEAGYRCAMLLHKRYGPWRIGPADGPNMAPEIYSLTSRGFEFLQRYKSGQPVEQPPP
jgi:hypothetical protein